MSNQTAQPASPAQAAGEPERTRPGDRANLDRQYRTIGISAVAAALPYSGGAKNPAYARTRSRDDERSEFDRRSVFTV